MMVTSKVRAITDITRVIHVFSIFSPLFWLDNGTFDPVYWMNGTSDLKFISKYLSTKLSIIACTLNSGHPYIFSLWNSTFQDAKSDLWEGGKCKKYEIHKLCKRRFFSSAGHDMALSGGGASLLRGPATQRSGPCHFIPPWLHILS